jgi:hypothetical protein
MKKTFTTILAAVLFTISLAGCGSNLKLVRDDVGDQYRKTHFPRASISAFKLTRGWFDHYIGIYRRDTIQDPNMAEKDKEIIIAGLDTLIYEDDQYYGYIIDSSEPILKSKLNMKFTMEDNKNKNLVDRVLFMDLVTRYYSNYILVSTTWQYIFIIKSKIPIASDTEANNIKPINLVVTYPNGNKEQYSMLK